MITLLPGEEIELKVNDNTYMSKINNNDYMNSNGISKYNAIPIGMSIGKINYNE